MHAFRDVQVELFHGRSMSDLIRREPRGFRENAGVEEKKLSPRQTHPNASASVIFRIGRFLVSSPRVRASPRCPDSTRSR